MELFIAYEGVVYKTVQDRGVEWNCAGCDLNGSKGCDVIHEDEEGNGNNICNHIRDIIGYFHWVEV